MANPGALVREMATVLGVSEQSMLTYDRLLAEAGLRSRRGRGWSAPVVTARDAALLLTAVLASPQVKEAPKTVERYLETRALPKTVPFAAAGLVELEQLPKAHSFVDAIEGLFSAGVRGAFGPDQAIELQVAAISPGTRGEIRLAGSSAAPVLVRYVDARAGSDEPPARRSERQSPSRADLDQIRRVSERTFFVIGNLIRPEEIP